VFSTGLGRVPGLGRIGLGLLGARVLRVQGSDVQHR
jgi:hypothetical protein